MQFFSVLEKVFYLHPTLLTIIHFLNFFINFQFVIKQLLTFDFCTNTMIVRNENGGIDMIDQPMEFFRNLPTKTCAHCGKEIDEQHEAYHNKCDDCVHEE